MLLRWCTFGNYLISVANNSSCLTCLLVQSNSHVTIVEGNFTLYICTSVHDQVWQVSTPLWVQSCQTVNKIHSQRSSLIDKKKCPGALFSYFRITRSLWRRLHISELTLPNFSFTHLPTDLNIIANRKITYTTASEKSMQDGIYLCQ